MDILILMLIIVAILALGGWGYGTYAVRPAPGAAVETPATAAWVNPIGVIGLLAAVAIVFMLATGWRPFVIGP
jgi:hypothetical protein